MRWFLTDVLGLFSANVGPFSRNVVPSTRIFSINLVPKQRMLSVPAIYVLSPLQVIIQNAVEAFGLDFLLAAIQFDIKRIKHAHGDAPLSLCLLTVTRLL